MGSSDPASREVQIEDTMAYKGVMDPKAVKFLMEAYETDEERHRQILRFLDAPDDVIAPLSKLSILVAALQPYKNEPGFNPEWGFVD